MGFMNSMKSTLNEDFNESYTENGALGYRTTGKHLLDLNFKVASLRKADAETIISGFDKAFSEDHIHALKWLFYLRDAREGLGNVDHSESSCLIWQMLSRKSVKC